MKKVYLINIEDIKKESILPSNTDEKILQIALREATELELENLISKEYLNKLNDAVRNNTLTENDKKVINEVIQPFLVYATLFFSIPYLHNKLNNKGVNVSTDATLTASSASNVDTFQRLVNQRFDSYKKRLINYFCEDENIETNTNPLVSTTASVLGLYIPDVKDDFEMYSKMKASKVNYYR